MRMTLNKMYDDLNELFTADSIPFDKTYLCPLLYIDKIEHSFLDSIGIKNNDGTLITMDDLFLTIPSTLTTICKEFFNERSSRLICDRFSHIYEDVMSHNGVSAKLILLNEMFLLSKTIYELFNEKWKRLYLALIDAEYNPIENYSSTENESYNNKQTTSYEGYNTSVVENQVNAFNSSSWRDSEKSSTTDTPGVTTTIEGDDEHNNRELLRHGNIGVMSNQNMIEQEIVLRDKKQFIEFILQDIDEYILLQYA